MKQFKTVYLANENDIDGNTKLVEISAKKWHTIIKEQDDMSFDKRRHFMYDIIVESDWVDCLIIELTVDQWRAWNNEERARRRNRKYKRLYQMLSLDYVIDEQTGATLISHGIAGDGCEDDIIFKCVIQDLKSELVRWQPWAVTILECYLTNNDVHCTGIIAEKYGVTMRTARRYKKQFEEFVREFFS